MHFSTAIIALCVGLAAAQTLPPPVKINGKDECLLPLQAGGKAPAGLPEPESVMINGAATLVPPTIKKDGKDSCDYGVKARQAGAAPTLEVVQFNATFSFCALPATDGKCVLPKQ